MKWAKRVGIGLAALLVVLLVLPFFIALDDYIPQIEKEATARLGEPVRIKSLKVALMPLPHLTVAGITVGKDEELKVGKVTATPELMSLFGSPRVIRTIEIDGVVLTQKALEKLPVWTKGDPKAAQQPPQIRVETIRLDDALIRFDGAGFGPFHATAKLDRAGEPQSVSIATRDGKLKLEVKPEKSSYRIEALAKGWQPPVGPRVLFDELTIRGIATLNDAELTEVCARVYSGSVTGSATVAWKKGLQVKGKAAVQQVEIRPVLLALGRPPILSGKLTASPVFSGAAATAAQLGDALRLEMAFDVRNGVLHGIDISKAATSFIGKEGSKGGETRFDQLSGHLAVDRGTRRLTQIRISSGILAADGNVTISPKNQLSGRINANVKIADVSTGVPLNVSGTMQSPLVYPTGGTLAGAAAGTALMGPGLGTTAGAKVGGWVEGLFGKKEESAK